MVAQGRRLLVALRDQGTDACTQLWWVLVVFVQVAVHVLRRVRTPSLSRLACLLHIAAEQDDVEAILNAVADDPGIVHSATNLEGVTLLHRAISNASPRVVRALIDAKADVHAREMCDWTPMMRAAGINYHHSAAKVEIVKALLKANADVNASGQMGFTPLAVLPQHETNEDEETVLRLLLAANAEPNIVGDSPSPIMTAVMYRHPGPIEILLKANADPNLIGPPGYALRILSNKAFSKEAAETVPESIRLWAHLCAGATASGAWRRATCAG